MYVARSPLSNDNTAFGPIKAAKAPAPINKADFNKTVKHVR